MKKKQVTNLFTDDEAIGLIKFWLKEHEWVEGISDEDTAYNNGIAAGCDFALMVLGRTGD